MTVEYLVKRTIYVSHCEDCGREHHTESDNPPRERLCECGQQWVAYKEVSAISPEYKHLPK